MTTMKDNSTLFVYETLKSRVKAEKFANNCIHFLHNVPTFSRTEVVENV